MLINRFLTVVILLTCLQILACEDVGHGNTKEGKWDIITESSFLDTSPFEPLKFFDEKNGLAIQGSSIQQTSDSGRSWSTVFYKDGEGVAAGIFTIESEGWVVGHKTVAPLVLKTLDGGRSWSEIVFDEKSKELLNGKIKSLWDICFDSKGIAWVTGEGGLLQVQVGEDHLRLLGMFPTNNASDRIACSGSGDVWALGRESSIFHFRETWVKKKLNPSYSPNNIRAFGDDVWVTGKDGSGNGILLQSRDSGESWQNKAPKSAKALNDIFLKDGNGWLVGVEGLIYETTDNGETWIESKSPTNANLLHICSLNLNNAWISGDRETVLKYWK